MTGGLEKKEGREGLSSGRGALWPSVSDQRKASLGSSASGAKVCCAGEPAMWTSRWKMVQAEGTVSAKALREEKILAYFRENV